MVVMALDHVRFFFTNVRFAPEDIDHTWLALFLTRWITHFCAPLFFFLAGMSAYLSASRRAESPSRHLFVRGLWLVLLELTVIGFAWDFVPGSSFAGVIWALGWSMVILSALVRVDIRVIAVLSLLVISLHDLSSNVPPEAFGRMEPLWRILHVSGPVHFGNVKWFVLFPIIPWFAVMSLGFAAGCIWTWSAERRSRLLLASGVAASALFVVLRMTNAYGNPPGVSSGRVPFAFYPAASKTLISLLNVCKYPPSLQFLLMTLGPSMILLAVAGAAASVVITFGRVPFFYYICHLYLIHALALILLQPKQGYGLPGVYAVWIVVNVMLYFPCHAFENLKLRSGAAWLRFV